MSAVVRLSSKLPGDDAINGIDSTVAELLSTPETVRVGIIYYDVAKVVHDVPTNKDVPTLQIRRIEPIGTADSVPVEIREAFLGYVAKRTGKEPLPFEQTSSDAAGTGALD